MLLTVEQVVNGLLWGGAFSLRTSPATCSSAVSTTVSVTSSATAIVTANANRLELSITNRSATETLYVFPSPSLTVGGSVPIPPNTTAPVSPALAQLAWYGITSGPTISTSAIGGII